MQLQAHAHLKGMQYMNSKALETNTEKTILYIHGQGGNAGEAAHYRPLFPDCRVVGMEYRAASPWEAAEEFPRLYDALCGKCASVTLIANSIGAYYAMLALSDRPFEKAFFISPVTDMERLILDLMADAHVTEAALQAHREIPTASGGVLSWDWLCRVRSCPITWNVPTYVLYGGRDTLLAPETFSAFAEKTGASLTVMEQGEHWFHTPAQMDFLDRWIRSRQ